MSVTGGPELSLKEIHQIMDQFHRLSDHAQVIMGAAIDPGLAGRVAVTVIAARHPPADPGESPPSPAADEPTAEAIPPTTDFPTRPRPEGASRLLGDRPPRGYSRYVAPPPELTPEQTEQLLARQQGGSTWRRQRQKLQQGLLPLEVVSKGRFAKSDPTVHHGENLDTPTYIRRGMPLN